MKPKIAFVDHSYHKKTRSGDFLRELFASEFEVVDIWDDSWRPESPPYPLDEINRGGFSRVFFFQSLPDVEMLRRVDVPMVWAPMYDTLMNWNRGGDFWAALMDVPLKILCFCRELYNLLQGRGFDCLYAQYFPDPEKFIPIEDYSEHRVFFWQRRNLRFSHVCKIIEGNPLGAIIVKLDPDPGFLAEPISRENAARYKVSKIVNGGMELTAYLDLLRTSNIFIAPREHEGIGMSFLEAMAMGMTVIGKNQPTLNEYIRHGENGLLWDNAEQRVDFGDIERLGRRARLDCEQGFQQWQAHKHSILRCMRENTV